MSRGKVEAVFEVNSVLMRFPVTFPVATCYDKDRGDKIEYIYIINGILNDIHVVLWNGSRRL